MTSSPDHETGPILPWWRDIDPTATAFFLDVDGTLVDFKSRPEHVVADAALLALLDTLRQVAGGALALVSGRMVQDLDRIVAPLTLPAGGVHGADIRFVDGRRLMVGAAAMDPVREAVRAFVEPRQGLMLEDKGATLAIHYRHAPEREPEVRAFLADIQGRGGLAVQEGKLVAELKPTGCDKGTAITTLLEGPPFQGRRPLFIGDDLTDEHGFRAVNAVEGVSIKVGSPKVATIAHYRLAHPEDVRAFLRFICRSAPPR